MSKYKLTKTTKEIYGRTLESKQEKWEIDFDDRFNYSVIDSVIRDMGDDATWLTMRDNIKSFIRTTLTAQKEKIVEMCEGLRLGEKIRQRQGNVGEKDAYNQALDDLKGRVANEL